MSMRVNVNPNTEILAKDSDVEEDEEEEEAVATATNSMNQVDTRTVRHEDKLSPYLYSDNDESDHDDGSVEQDHSNIILSPPSSEQFLEVFTQIQRQLSTVGAATFGQLTHLNLLKGDRSPIGTTISISNTESTKPIHTANVDKKSLPPSLYVIATSDITKASTKALTPELPSLVSDGNVTEEKWKQLIEDPFLDDSLDDVLAKVKKAALHHVSHDFETTPNIELKTLENDTPGSTNSSSSFYLTPPSDNAVHIPLQRPQGFQRTPLPNAGNARNSPVYTAPMTTRIERAVSPDNDMSRARLVNAEIEHEAQFVWTDESNEADNSTSFGGFTTASKKPITISADSKVRAKKLLSELEIEDKDSSLWGIQNDSNAKSTPYSGFTTGLNKPVAVSEASRARAKAKLADFEEDSTLIPVGKMDDLFERGVDTPVFSGFSTGNNKRIVVSEASRARANAMFADLDKEGLPMISVSKEDNFSNSREETSSFSGFSTGNNKRIEVSDATRARAKALMAEFDQEGDKFPVELGGPAAKSLAKTIVQPSNHRTSPDPRRHSFSDDKENYVDNQARSYNTPSRLGASTTAFDALSAKRPSNFTDNTSKRRKPSFNTPRPLLAVQQGRAIPKPNTPSTSASTNEKTLLNVRKINNVAGSSDVPFRSIVTSPPHFPSPVVQNDLPIPCAPASVDSFFPMQHTPIANFPLLLFHQLSRALVFMESTTAASFVLPSPDPLYPDLNANQMHRLLLKSGLDASLCTLEWVTNHWRWIVWKLACYERSFPRIALCTLTKWQLYQQFRKRYNVEFDCAKRPAIKIILERDDVSTRYMVLAIASIIRTTRPVPDAKPADNADDMCDNDSHTSLLIDSAAFNCCQIELTDGWYSIPAQLDDVLLQALQKGSLFIGQKLRIYGAQLSGSSDPTTPLENTSTYMILRSNGTRRARWNAKLGMQKTGFFSVNLASVKPSGGVVPCVFVVIERVFPMVYLETLENKVRVHRNNKAEDNRQSEWEKQAEAKAELLREEIERKYASLEIDASDDVSDIILSEMNPDIEMRTTIPYMKVAVREIFPPSMENTNNSVFTGSTCELTIWRPSELQLNIYTEGSSLALYNVQARQCYGMGGLSEAVRLDVGNGSFERPLPSTFKEYYRRPSYFWELKSFAHGKVFDAVVSVVLKSEQIQLNEYSTLYRLFCVGESHELLVVEVTETDFVKHLPKTLSSPLVMLMCNLVYRGYDARFRVHSASTTMTSSFTTHSPSNTPPSTKGFTPHSQLFSELHRMSNWSSTPGAKQQIDDAIARAHSILYNT